MQKVDLDKVFLYRRKAGLTQKQVGEVLGFKTATTYHRLERGEKPMRVDHLFKLAELFEVNILDLFTANQGKKEVV